MTWINNTIKHYDKELATEIALDLAFPNRTDSKTEEYKGLIMDLVRQRDEYLKENEEV